MQSQRRSACVWVALVAWWCAAVARAQESLELSGPVELAWKTRIDHVGPADDSFRAVAAGGGRVYAAGAVDSLGSGDRLLVVARNAASGALIWENASIAIWDASPQHPNGLALAPDGQRVYATHFAPAAGLVGMVSVLDAASGALVAQWTTAGALSIAGLQDVATSPDGSRVYATGATLTFPKAACTVAFDAASGAVVWAQSEAGGAIGSTPTRIAIDPTGQRVFEARALSLVAYDAASGTKLWTKSDGMRRPVSTRGREAPQWYALGAR
ncbi:MAG: hypothetical protein EPO68_08000 [Planctomycetota bacterium]|nr:MAG: hypothetical protein EPO68_08000 [Planctomycetota bacterium]